MDRFMVLPPDSLTDELRTALLERGAELKPNQYEVELIWIPLGWIQRIDGGFSSGENVVILDNGLTFEI